MIGPLIFYEMSGFLYVRHNLFYAELAQLVQHRFAKPAFRKGARLQWSLFSTDRSGAEKSGFKSLALRSTQNEDRNQTKGKKYGTRKK